MKASTIAAGVMLGAPFVLLASVYAALPAELPIVRSAFATGVLVAAKSPFTVFRVPLMNLTHGLMAMVMLAHTTDFKSEDARASYFALFSTLLFVIALKSNFEALELGGLAWSVNAIGRWATAGTLVSVIGGVMLALFRSRRARIPWRELRLAFRDKALLITLFAVYLAIVTRSLLIGHRG